MTTVLGRSAPRPAPFDSPIGLLMATDYDFTLEEVRDAVRDRVSCDDLCKAKNLGSSHFLLDRLVCMLAFRLLLGQRPNYDRAHDCKSLHTIYYSLAENKHATNTLPSFRCEMSVKSLSSATFIVGVSLLSTSICGYGADKSFDITTRIMLTLQFLPSGSASSSLSNAYRAACMLRPRKPSPHSTTAPLNSMYW